MKKNPSLSLLEQGYLFAEIAKRVSIYKNGHPESNLINLGIGDTTTPFPAEWIEEFIPYVHSLCEKEGYTGYGPSAGRLSLREKIADELYQNTLSPTDIFISDGAKCDISRLQLLFSSDCRIGLQDPAYPAYIDSSLLFGKKQIIFLPCTKENNFFPDLYSAPPLDLLIMNYPNNPTGAMATRSQLKELIIFCRSRNILLIYDNAYSSFIQDPSLPKSIYEIDGAREAAIEVGSFSKMAGFTGTRLGWCVVPKELRFSDGSAIQKEWIRIVDTTFNGPSTLSQTLAETVLRPDNFALIHTLTKSYVERAKQLKKTVESLGFPVFGALHCPYLWVEIQKYQNSWEAFEAFMQYTQLITTPGSGFGPSGEGFIRMSAFAPQEQINIACQRLLQNEMANLC